MAGARPEADIENGPGREHCKLNALHQAERARKFAEQELRGKGGRQNQRNAIEAQRIERDGKSSSSCSRLRMKD
jgi:hypothetical protein